MASKGKERENYFRINVLVVDHIKDALVHMFKYYLREYKKNMSFEEFIGEHMADIRKLRRRTRSLNQKEVDKLIVDGNAISGLTVDDLEVTLVRRLLDNLCPDLFMDDGCKTLQDFLKKNQHDIYHLFKVNEQCCQCSQDYTFPVTEELLEGNQYKNMFESSPCTNCAGKSGTVCSVSSCKDTEYILLDYGTRCKVFKYYSHIFKAMQKLIDIRNEAYGHIKAAMIPNELYDKYKQDIEENIMVLAKICGNEDETRLALDDVQKRSCDETLCIQYQNSLIELMQREKELEKRIEELAKKWETTETNLTKDVADNRQKIDDINNRHIPLNIRKGHVALINKWRKEDELFYDKTQGFTATLKMVKAKRYMTIIGGPGSGKTATARHIALQLERPGWEVVPVCRIEEIIQYGDRDHKQVFVLDDVLGIFAVKIDHIMNHQENIVTTIGETSKLLFTCRKSVYNEAFKLGLFVTENVVDLQSKDNQLTETEKMAIFQYHCKSKGVNTDLYPSISFTKANHMFPLLCKLFSREEQYQQLGESFFNKPFDYFISELDKLQVRNIIQYAVLVLCLVNGGKLSVEVLPHEHMQKEVFNDCGVNLGTTEKQIKDAIYHMSETYFTKLDNEYTFTHDFIFEAIAYHYGCQNKCQILKYLSSSYIANKVTVYEQASNQDLCIHLSEDMYLPLAERLYKDIQSMNLFDVFMNKSLQHGPFLDFFVEMLKTKPFDEFESLILRKHFKHVCHFGQKTFYDTTEVMRLHLLFITAGCEISDLEHSVRVISWIINYGHTHLLQEIVNHVKYNDQSISLIFGSNVLENTRCLLFGCYSRKLDMVELILKYVDPTCIESSLYFTLGTPLTAASEVGNLDIVKALLENITNVNKCNLINESSLYVAARNGDMDVARCLLRSGADINLCDAYGRSPLFIASSKGHCDIVKDLVAHNADVNLTDEYNHSPLYSAAKNGHYDIFLFLLQNGADVNISDFNNTSPLYVDTYNNHLSRFIYPYRRAGTAKSPFISRSIYKRTNGNEILSDSNALLNPCGYPEEKISHSKEKQEEEKEVFCSLKVQERIGKTTFTREQEEKEEIIYTRETKEENEETIDRIKVQVKNIREIVKISDKEVVHAEIYGQTSFLISVGGDALLIDNGNTSPLSIAVENGHFDIVKCILENSSDFNVSDTCKPPLFLAAEIGYHDILVLLLHSKYNDIEKKYLDTTPLEIAVWRNKTKVVQLLIQEENKLQKYRGNYHLFEILVDLKRSEFCINEQTGEEDCHTKDRNHHHLPYPLWNIITEGINDYLTHLLKIGLDINKRDYNGNTLFYKILNIANWTLVSKFKILMEHFEDVNVGGNKWISLLEMKRGQVRYMEDIDNRRHGVLKKIVPLCNDTLSEFRKHVRRHSI